MKKIIGLLALLGLTACGNSSFEAVQMTCTIENNSIVCPDGESTELPRDGVDGRDGQAGIDGIDGEDGKDGTQIDIVDPCGDGPGVDEVVLIFETGTVLAWFKDLGLTVLQEGVRYQTTDSQKCKFSVLNGQVVSEK